MAFLICSIMIIGIVSASSLNALSGHNEASHAIVAAAPSGAPFNYIVVIMMENQGNTDIISSASYMTQLANNYSYAEGYSAVDHPDLPNYLALLGGSTFRCSGYDGDPNSNSCTSSAWNSPNLVDRIEGTGLTWKAYMENMPSNCYGSDSGNYAVRHDPFVYFSDIVNNQARCARVVPAGSSDSALINDLGSTSTASNFIWLTPNLCHDMQDCSVSTGDSYLSQLVPRIFGSNIFKTQKAAIFITFDEGNGDYPADYLYTVWAGSVVKKNYVSSTSYTHYSLLKTIEQAWGLQPLTSTDTGAAGMSEFLTDFSGGGYTGSFCLFAFCYSTQLWLLIVAGIIAVTGAVVIGTVRHRSRSHTRHRRPRRSTQARISP